MTTFLKTGDIIKHKTHLNMAFQVTKAIYGTHDVVVIGKWINQGQTAMFVVDPQEIFMRIYEEDLTNWVTFSVERSLRKGIWVEIKGAA